MTDDIYLIDCTVCGTPFFLLKAYKHFTTFCMYTLYIPSHGTQAYATWERETYILQRDLMDVKYWLNRNKIFIFVHSAIQY